MKDFCYEPVTIEMLRPGVPFYMGNPLEHPNCPPSYNVNCDLPADTEVWVVYPSWQTNPFIKKECRVTVKSQALAGLINSKDSSWF